MKTSENWSEWKKWEKRFLEALRLKHYSGRTLEGYESGLRPFLKWVEQQQIPGPAVVSASMVNAYRQMLFHGTGSKGKRRGASTLNRYLIALRGFFHFLKVEGVVGRDPTEGQEYSREPQRLPRDVLTPREAQRVIETPDVGTELGYRDRTILEVLYATGIRRNELLGLEVGDIDFLGGLLRVNQGKGGRDRMTPLSRMACRFLENYIKAVRPHFLKKGNESRLFLSKRGRPLNRETLRWLIGKYARLAGLEKRVTPHLWRHTCATHLVRNRANLRHVQEMLGHRNLATTERYLSLTITDLKAAHRKFHPRERKAQDWD